MGEGLRLVREVEKNDFLFINLLLFLNVIIIFVNLLLFFKRNNNFYLFIYLFNFRLLQYFHRSS